MFENAVGGSVIKPARVAHVEIFEAGRDSDEGRTVARGVFEMVQLGQVHRIQIRARFGKQSTGQVDKVAHAIQELHIPNS